MARVPAQDNVELVRTPIERIVADGIVTDDGTHPADVICYATGFRHNDYLWPMTITGRDGRCFATSGATNRRRTSASPCRTPELLLPLRPGDEPRGRG